MYTIHKPHYRLLHATCTWTLTCIVVVPMCKLRYCCIPLQLAPMDAGARSPLTFSNLRWWCFSFQQLVQTLYLHLWWLPSATCAGGRFPSTTCAYSNLKLCGGGGIYIYIHIHTYMTYSPDKSIRVNIPSNLDFLPVNELHNCSFIE